MSSAPRLYPDPPDSDSLASLEERIRKTVEMVATLKSERDEAIAERERIEKAAAGALSENQQLRREVEELRRERNAVRTRIEKLLSQMDTLAG